MEISFASHDVIMENKLRKIKVTIDCTSDFVFVDKTINSENTNVDILITHTTPETTEPSQKVIVVDISSIPLSTKGEDITVYIENKATKDRKPSTHGSTSSKRDQKPG